jgi:hypothetical protein
VNSFSLAAYRDLIGALLGRGYEIRDFSNAAAMERHLILRHDVDMSLAKAAAMADLEAELRVRSTYFVLLRSELYNPFTPESVRVLGAIVERGHDIGLHLDASLYPNEAAALDTAARRECGLLEDLVGRAVRTVSFHRPAPALLGLERKLGGRDHAYHPHFYAEMGYCSDSRGRWGHGHPLDHPAVKAGTALQLLTHPIWWVGDGSPQDRLNCFLDRRFAVLDRTLADNCSVHQSRKDHGYEHEG